MLKLINRLLGREPTGDALLRLAAGHDRRAFALSFLGADVFIAAALTDDGLDPSTMTPEELLARIEANAKDLDEDKPREPFVYERDGRRVMPVFTTQAHAETFIGKYSRQRNRVFGFQLLGVKGATVLNVLAACDVAVLNDASPGAYALTLRDVEIMQSLGT